MFFDDASHSKKNQINYANQSASHAKFGLRSTLYLAYRDSKELLTKHLFQRSLKTTYRLLDYGCGAGLSTSIYAQIIRDEGYGVEIIGADINDDNLHNARIKMPDETFVKVDHEQSIEYLGKFDLIICNFVLVEHPYASMLEIIKQLRPLLEESGVLITTNTTRQAYKSSNRWYSLNNNFVENMPHEPKGSKLIISDDQTVSLAINDPEKKEQLFQFFDFFHSGRAYRRAYAESGLELIQTHKPVGTVKDYIPWLSEMEASPYKIHVLYPNRSYLKSAHEEKMEGGLTT